jgi:putative ABC transport system substrate-binding protein
LNVPILQLPERTGSLRLAMRYLARVWLGDAEGYFPILDSDVWDAPGVTRAAVLRDAALAASIGQFGAIQAVAPSVGVEVSPINIRDAGEIERAVAAFARSGNGGLIVTGSALAQLHRNLIITLAARHRLPAVYFERFFVTGGGLISYGPDLVDQYRRAAGYVDRILRGEKPADLPVQAPTKYETTINLKTAKALGLEVPATVLARADEVIE